MPMKQKEGATENRQSLSNARKVTSAACPLHRRWLVAGCLQSYDASPERRVQVKLVAQVVR
jgi:hypothetical protein